MSLRDGAKWSRLCEHLGGRVCAGDYRQSRGGTQSWRPKRKWVELFPRQQADRRPRGQACLQSKMGQREQKSRRKKSETSYQERALDWR